MRVHVRRDRIGRTARWSRVAEPTVFWTGSVGDGDHWNEAMALPIVAVDAGRPAAGQDVRSMPDTSLRGVGTAVRSTRTRGVRPGDASHDGAGQDGPGQVGVGQVGVCLLYT